MKDCGFCRGLSLVTQMEKEVIAVGGLMERPARQGTEANSTGKELVHLHGNWKMQLTN